MKLGYSAIALCAVLAACGESAAVEDKAAPADTSAAKTEVKLAEADLASAFLAKDAQRTAAHYADDARIYTPSSAPKTPAEMVKDFEDPAFRLTFTNLGTEVAASGDMAYTRGTFQVTFTNPANKRATSMTGNYLTVFRKGADGWKIVEDISTPGPAGG